MFGAEVAKEQSPRMAAKASLNGDGGYSIEPETPRHAETAAESPVAAVTGGAPSPKTAAPTESVVETPKSTAPPPASTIAPSHAAPREEESDAQVDELCRMFSGLDRDTIEDVLASNHGHADAAVSQLLELTGGAPATGNAAVAGTREQEVADEEYARRLMAEEHAASAHYGQLNYQPRQRRPGGLAGTGQLPSNATDGGQPKDDQFDAALESIKTAAGNASKVATGWLNKATSFAKDKYGEFEQQRAQKAAQQSQVDASPATSAPTRRQSDTQSTPATARTAPALPHGNRYARSSSQTKTSLATPPHRHPSVPESEQSPRERIGLVDNTRERTAEDSDDEDGLEYTRSPFEED